MSFVQGKDTSNSAWKISANDDEDFIDEDALLDEDDLKKPDPSSLKGFSQYYLDLNLINWIQSLNEPLCFCFSVRNDWKTKGL